MTFATWARRRRSWLRGALPLGLLAVVVLVGSVASVASVMVGSSPSAASGTDDPVEPVPEADRVLPDVVVAIPDSETSADDASAIAATLARSLAIEWVADDQLATGRTNLVVAFDGATAGRRAVDAAIADRFEGQDGVEAAGVTVSGRDVTDREIDDRLGTGMLIAVLVAAIGAGGAVVWRVGLIPGLLSGGTLAAAGWLGATIGSSIAGSFNGSLATTALPAMLGAVVAAGYLIARLVTWFAEPEGEDPADTIRQAVLSVGIELLLVFAALAVATFFLELVGSAPSVGTVFFAGAITGAVLTLAVVPPVLASFGQADEPSWLPVPIPSGRDFPILVLIGFAAFLVVLGLFSFRTTGPGELLDERALGTESSAVAGTRELLANGGDPTSAIFAEFPPGTDQLAKASWLERISQLDAVERIDTVIGRYQDGSLTELEGLVGPPGIDATSDEAPRWALIVPGVTGRSVGAIELVGAIEDATAPVDAVLSGVPVEARAAAEHDRSQIWLTIVSLSVVGGVAVFALLGDLGTAGLAIAIRLVGLSAVAGLYQLLVGTVSGPEVQLVLLVVTLGTGLFELGYLRRLLTGHSAQNTDYLLDAALDAEGTAATFALGLGALAALGLLVPDLAIARRFAILLAVAILIKTAVGMWLLRPVVLGTRAISHFASRPVQLALRSLTGASVSSQAEHKAWVDVITGLLHTEFSFQADPAAADISSVFVPDTPLYRKSLDHHLNLADAGLRIVGRQPQLRALRVVSNAAPATVVVTVDHPTRQLLDGNGKVVGVRKAERRSVMLWMVMQRDGSYRIVDAVELGATALATTEAPAPVPSIVPAAVE